MSIETISHDGHVIKCSIFEGGHYAFECSSGLDMRVQGASTTKAWSRMADRTAAARALSEYVKTLQTPFSISRQTQRALAYLGLFLVLLSLVPA